MCVFVCVCVSVCVCVFVCVCVRGRKRQTDGQTDRERDNQTDKEKERCRYIFDVLSSILMVHRPAIMLLLWTTSPEYDTLAVTGKKNNKTKTFSINNSQVHALASFSQSRFHGFYGISSPRPIIFDSLLVLPVQFPPVSSVESMRLRQNCHHVAAPICRRNITEKEKKT